MFTCILFTFHVLLPYTYGGVMQGRIVGGKYVNITECPHSVFITIFTYKFGRETSGKICGGSILNQAIILTAAHCLDSIVISETSFDDDWSIFVHAGSKYKTRGQTVTATKFKIHENYVKPSLVNDIALVKLRQNLVFSDSVKRVSLTKALPNVKLGYVAGWGVINEKTKKRGSLLKMAPQIISTRDECNRHLGSVPKGTICGNTTAALGNAGYAAGGDSGSALIIEDYIQIGLVSYKLTKISVTLVVYTEVKYFYDWIYKAADSLYCKMLN